MKLRILHTNDLHGHLGDSGRERLRQLREEADLYLDSGDAVSYGNIALPVRQDPIWPVFEQLRLDAQVPGNREFHPLSSAMRGKLRGAKHPIVCANLVDRAGSHPFPPSIILERTGLRIGIVGFMVVYFERNNPAGMISEWIHTSPIPAAIEEGERIRGEVDLLIALTHIGLRRDRAIAEEGPFDVLLGGHSHDHVPPTRIGRCDLAQSGSHGRTAGVYEWNGTALAGEIVSLAP